MVITFTDIRKFDIFCAYKCHQSKPSSLDNCSTDSWSNELPTREVCAVHVKQFKMLHSIIVGQTGTSMVLQLNRGSPRPSGQIRPIYSAQYTLAAEGKMGRESTFSTVYILKV